MDRISSWLGAAAARKSRASSTIQIATTDLAVGGLESDPAQVSSSIEASPALRIVDGGTGHEQYAEPNEMLSLRQYASIAS
jgi:hypothetical protein